MLKYSSYGSCNIRVSGNKVLKNHIVRLEKTYEDPKEFIGKEVEVGRCRFRVAAVEKFMHAPPWKEGELVGLCEEVED